MAYIRHARNLDRVDDEVATGQHILALSRGLHLPLLPAMLHQLLRDLVRQLQSTCIDIHQSKRPLIQPINAQHIGHQLPRKYCTSSTHKRNLRHRQKLSLI